MFLCTKPGKSDLSASMGSSYRNQIRIRRAGSSPGLSRFQPKHGGAREARGASPKSPMGCHPENKLVERGWNWYQHTDRARDRMLTLGPWMEVRSLPFQDFGGVR